MQTEDGFQEVPIVLKADVDGALEAIVGSLMALPRSQSSKPKPELKSISSHT